jgi:WD40 repeat protein
VLWDYNPYQLFECLNTFSGHGYYECEPSTIAISPNGQTLATSNRNSELIKIWQLHTGQEICTITGHAKGTHSLAFSSEGQTLWGSSYCGHGDEYDNWFEIKQWNLQTGEVIHCLPGYGDFALSPDGQLLVTGSWDKIEVWDLQTEQKIRTLQGACWVKFITFSTDGKTLIGTDDMFGGQNFWTEYIKVWDLNTGQLIRTLGEKTEYCKAFILNPNGQTLISTTNKENLKIWDLSTGELLRTVMIPLSPLTLSLDGHTLINDCRNIGSINNTISVWDLRTWQKIPTFMKHPDITSIALSRDGQNIVSSNYNRTIKVWGVP